MKDKESTDIQWIYSAEGEKVRLT